MSSFDSSDDEADPAQGKNGDASKNVERFFKEDAWTDLAPIGRVNNQAYWGITAPLGGYFNTSNSSISGTGQEANPDTFWTVCYLCNIGYFVFRVHLHHFMFCQFCGGHFHATEKPVPISVRSFQQAPFSQGAISKASFQQKYQRAEGECEKASAANQQDGEIKRKYNASENASSEYFNSDNKRRCMEEAGLGTMSQRSLGAGYSTSTASIRHGSSKTVQKKRAKNVSGVKQLTKNQKDAILKEKARAMIQKKINEKK